MKKIEKRAIMCLLLAGCLVVGLGLFTYRYVVYGAEWATFGANRNIYNDKGHLSKGALYDADGDLLMNNNTGKMTFNENRRIRKAMVHLTGDRQGNIATGANRVFKDKFVGYNFLTGTYSTTGEGENIALTLDADICVTANQALDGRRGTVGVYNYKTGEIVCMVSSPNYDPLNPPEVSSNDKSGRYMNRFFSATLTPGSIFKLVVSAASIETKSDYDTWEYRCTGVEEYGPDKVTCPSAHGTVALEEALAKSCNCYFGKLTEALGPSVMSEYVDKLGLTESQNVSGIVTGRGTFAFPDSGVQLAWSGVGQHKDLLNPCAMMTYMGAIASEGTGVTPVIVNSDDLIADISESLPGTSGSRTMIEANTAATLKRMMRNNVEETYGTDSFPGLNICAKSGTAEVGKNKRPNAWFSGFLDDPENPYAFIVLVENGGWGKQVAGSIANKVLQELVE